MFSNNKLDSEQKHARSINIAKLFYQNKDFESAKEYIKELLEWKPDSTEAYRLLSQINEALGENELAIQNYQKSLELKSSENNNLFNDYSHFSSPSKLTFKGRSSLNNSFTGKNVQNHNSTKSMDNIDQTELMKNIEKMIDSKFSILMNSFQEFKDFYGKMDICNTNQQQNDVNLKQEISSFKVLTQQLLMDTNKKIASLIHKQDSLEKFIMSQFNQNNNASLKQEILKLNNSFNKFSSEINQKFDELNEKIGSMKFNDENYDDYYDEDDEEEDQDYDGDSGNYENVENHQKQLNTVGQQNLPKLNELFKFKQTNTWTCSVCCVSNDDSQTVCASCEEPRYPMQQQQKNQNLFSSPVSGTGFVPPPSSTNVTTTTTSGFVFGNFKYPQFNSTSSTSTATTTSNTTTTTNSSLFSFSSALNSIKNTNNPLTFSTFGSEKNDNNSSFLTSTTMTTTTSTATTANKPTFSFFNQSTPPSFKPPNFSNDPPTSTSPTTASNTNAAMPSKSFFGTTAPGSTTGSIFQFTNTSNPFPTNISFGSFSKPSTGAQQQQNSSGIFSFPKFEMQNLNSTPKESTDKNNADDNLENNDESADTSGDNLILPKVNLPEKYEHVTGEEDEVELYHVERAKLFCHVDNEYKERGTGVLKILRNKMTKKVRLVMRRDQVHKVCLNTPLTSSFKLEPKEKFLFFQCIDFSDNKPSPQTFLLKMSMANIQEFKKFVEDLVKNLNETISESIQQNETKENSVDNVQDDCKIVFIKEPKHEHRKMVESLKLPLNFYSYEEKPPCKGCIGCRVDELSWNNLTYSTVSEEDYSGQTSSNGFGIFSNLSSNVPEAKVDSIKTNKDSNADTESKSFVSEKSKLLPQNYKHTTGEENEESVYKERAKLYRYVKASNEYKERGVGEIKILKNKNKFDYRLLMRRDIIYNIICNHKITKQLSFKDKDFKTCLWATIDYSENPQGDDEIFLIKFKDENRKKEFLNKIEECKQNLEQN